MGRVVARRPVLRLDLDGEPVRRPDSLAVEEPLELRVGGEPLQVTMRTPGDDMDLAAGLLVAEGVIDRTEQLTAMRYCAGRDENGEQTYNVLDLSLAEGVDPARLQRRATTTSACGVCGAASLDLIRTATSFPVDDDRVVLDPRTLLGLPDALRTGQKVFDRTGGLHAAGLFTADGELLCLREDVGRHNAVDKVVGWALREGRLPLTGHVLAVSGRASFELVQKAVMAGLPAMVAVSAPSSLAVDLAVESGVTLVGFTRGRTANVYSRPDRLSPLPTDRDAAQLPPTPPLTV